VTICPVTKGLAEGETAVVVAAWPTVSVRAGVDVLVEKLASPE
jgi:hypothetical protein